MIKRVVEETPQDAFVVRAEVETAKVHFFFEDGEWFYITGDMYGFRNLQQTNGYHVDYRTRATKIKKIMNAIHPPRQIFQADDMYEFVEYIRTHPNGR